MSFLLFSRLVLSAILFCNVLVKFWLVFDRYFGQFPDQNSCGNRSLEACLVLSFLVFSRLVLSCLILSCLALSSLLYSNIPVLALPCLVLSYLVLSCLILPCLLFCIHTHRHNSTQGGINQCRSPPLGLGVGGGVNPSPEGEEGW